MNLEKLIIDEYGIEFAQDKIILQIKEKIEEYKVTKDKNVQKQLVQLLEDREKIYSNDKETIKKYIQ